MLIEKLLNPAIYPHPVKRVRLLETHISWILLAGRFAYKIKKPVNLQFLDFSLLSDRKFYCEEEIRLNRRLAPQLYLQVTGIGGSPEQPEFGSPPFWEYAVKMRRFALSKGAANLIEKSALQATHLQAFAIRLAQFHDSLPALPPDLNYGGPQQIQAAMDQNFRQLRELTIGMAAMDLSGLQADCNREFACRLNYFAQRRQQGFIRECHGDLHLDNLTLYKNQLIAFDSLEFNAEFRWIDVINEIGFLTMDLWFHQRQDLAYLLLNVYLEQTGDYSGLALLAYYQAYRALVRCKIALFSVNAQNQQQQLTQALRYWQLAKLSLQTGKPQLIICHGLPGSGKTYVSEFLMAKLPAIRLRSDVERKRLFGLKSRQSGSQAIYDPQATQNTYGLLLAQAGTLLQNGFKVIIDAAFLKQQERSAFKDLAKVLNIPFIILAVSCDAELMRLRIVHRQQRQNDASDADLTVLDELKQYQEAFTADELSDIVRYDNRGGAAEEQDKQVLLQQISMYE